jgi:hypothetical protein
MHEHVPKPVFHGVAHKRDCRVLWLHTFSNGDRDVVPHESFACLQKKFLTSSGANGSPSGPTSSILYLTFSGNFLVGPRFGLVEEWPDPDPEG